jgi:hypothetical protein
VRGRDKRQAESLSAWVLPPELKAAIRDWAGRNQGASLRRVRACPSAYAAASRRCAYLPRLPYPIVRLRIARVALPPLEPCRSRWFAG